MKDTQPFKKYPDYRDILKNPEKFGYIKCPNCGGLGVKDGIICKDCNTLGVLKEE